jgi:tRNA threonylcarbamoyladenosine biosynthesis protein TsaE
VLEVSSIVASPTYSIINEYKSALLETVYHMDWYRLSGEEEALQAGVEEVLYSGDLCLVEWPARAAGLLPPATLGLHIDIQHNGNRRLTLQQPI